MSEKITEFTAKFREGSIEIYNYNHDAAVASIHVGEAAIIHGRPEVNSMGDNWNFDIWVETHTKSGKTEALVTSEPLTAETAADVKEALREADL